MDISPQRTHAVVGGKDVLKTIRVSPESSIEEFNIRDAIVDQASSRSGALSARYREQLTVRDVKWSHGNYSSVIATAVANGRIVVYDLNIPGLELSRFQGHSRQVHRLAVNPYLPAYILSGSQDSTIRMWDLRISPIESSGGCRKIYNGNSDAIRDIRWSPTNGYLFATATDSGAIQLWDDRRTSAPLMRIVAHDKPCQVVDWHPDGKYLVSGGLDKQVKGWNFSTSAERRQKPTFQFRVPQGVLNVRWRPPGWPGNDGGGAQWCTQLVTSYDKEDPRLHLWDIRRPHIPVREFDRYDTQAADVLWHSRDLLWSVGESGSFTQSDVRYAPRVINRRPMCSVAWSPSGDVLAFVQKRPQPTAAQDSADFLSAGDGIDEKESGRSPNDEAIDEASRSSSFQRQHSRTRSSKSSLGTTPPNLHASMPVLPLDKALLKSHGSDSCQAGTFGTIPEATVDLELFNYLSRHYSPLMAEGTPDENEGLVSLLESFDENAKCAARASRFRLAQTWQVARFSLIQDLQRRARKQRDREQNERATSCGGEELPAEKHRMLHEGGKDKMKTRLFKRVAEAEGHHIQAEAESTSNMTTPLARPIPDSPRVKSFETESTDFSSLSDGGIQALPPSAFRSDIHSSGESRYSHADLRPLEHRPSESSDDGFMQTKGSSLPNAYHLEPPASLPADQRSAPLAITGRTDWHMQDGQDFSKEASDEYEKKIQDKRAALRDYKQLPKRLLSLEPSIQSSTRRLSFPGPDQLSRRESSDSFPMFSASTDSLRHTKSFMPSFSSREEAPLNSPFDDDSVRSGDALKRGFDASPPAVSDALGDEEGELDEGAADEAEKEEGILKDPSFDESPSIPSTKVHLLRPSGPVKLHAESSPLEVSRAIHANKQEPRMGLPLSGMLEEDFSRVNIPVTPDAADIVPWGIGSLLGEAIRYYCDNAPLDIPTAAHLLQKLDLLFRQRDKVLSYEECELIFRMYNEHLLRQSMYVDAAELRLHCVPSYPAVYRYAQVDTSIKVFCFTCRRPYENPVRDNTRCHRCNTPQGPCPVCLSIDPPSEFVDDMSTETPAEPSESLSSSSSSTPSLSPTEPSTPPPEDASSEVVVSIARPKGSALWAWCQGCGHGGHVACMAMWLSDLSVSEGGCATAGCMHNCALLKRI